MPNHLDAYQTTTADWRKTLKQNNTRTYLVISLFFLIYCAIGLLIDTYLNAISFPQASITQIFIALITLQLFPLVTLIMLGIATISLWVSYILHDKLMLLGTEYHEITPQTLQNQAERQLYNVVEEMKIAMGLGYMPKVYLIQADYMNAFASGYSEKSAMVAITRGLMEKLNRDELQAVMAHELSHIKHLDIKLTLTASLLTNLTLIVLDVFFYKIAYSDKNRSRQSLVLIITILRYLLPLITVLLLLYLSRTRELMADAGSVQFMRNNQPLASALIKINQDHLVHRDQYREAYARTSHENVRQQAYIYNPHEAGIASLNSIADFFSTHPALETRLAALGFKKKQTES